MRKKVKSFHSIFFEKNTVFSLIILSFKEANEEQNPANRSVLSKHPLNSLMGSTNENRASSFAKNTLRTTSVNRTESPEKKKEDPQQNPSEKEDDSDMLIRENSSLESEDFLEIEAIKTQIPRESIVPSLKERKSLKTLEKTFDAANLSETTIKKTLQDKLQKELFTEKSELKEERLMAEDNDLEKNLRIMVERKLKIALNLTKEYNILLNRIDSVIYARMNIFNMTSKNIPFLKHIQHKVPTFILQNIQLYETVFSFLRLHPCYIMRIISTHLLNNSQVISHFFGFFHFFSLGQSTHQHPLQ